MPKHQAKLLLDTITRELPHLEAITEEAASIHPAGPDSWSPKQELGHLIDSAANNHIRFVRATLEPEITGPGYQQNGWVDVHGYQQQPWLSIVSFWHSYNTFLVTLLERIPDEKLVTICKIGSYEPATLGFIIEDYVLHLQHHVDHLLQRAAITTYPSAGAMAK
jgi:hypothetical protein